MSLRLEASKTRRVSTDRRECTQKYTTKAARNATPKCDAYNRRAIKKRKAFALRF